MKAHTLASAALTLTAILVMVALFNGVGQNNLSASAVDEETSQGLQVEQAASAQKEEDNLRRARLELERKYPDAASPLSDLSRKAMLVKAEWVSDGDPRSKRPDALVLAYYEAVVRLRVEARERELAKAASSQPRAVVVGADLETEWKASKAAVLAKYPDSAKAESALTITAAQVEQEWLAANDKRMDSRDAPMLVYDEARARLQAEAQSSMLASTTASSEYHPVSTDSRSSYPIQYSRENPIMDWLMLKANSPEAHAGTAMAVIAALLIAFPFSLIAQSKWKRKASGKRPFTWGYYIAAMTCVWGIIWIVLSFNTPLIPEKNVNKPDLLGILIGALLMVCSWGMVKRHRWAWVTGIILHLHPGSWFINGWYIANRWREMKSEHQSPTAKAKSPPEDPGSVNPDLPEIMYLYQDGRQSGPFHIQQVLSMWSSGLITADASYCHSIEGDWQPILPAISGR